MLENILQERHEIHFARHGSLEIDKILVYQQDGEKK